MGFSRARIVDRFASTLWGKSTGFRDHFARQLVLPAVFSAILILVDAAIFFGNKSENGGTSINLLILLGLHLTYAIGMLIWAMQSKSDLDQMRIQLGLQDRFRKELLDVPDLNTIAEKLFQYIRCCVPVAGGAFYYERSPGDGYQQIKEEWFSDKHYSADASEFERLPCDHPVSRPPQFSNWMTNPFHWIDHGSFMHRSKIICQGIFVRDRKIAIICLYFNSGYNPSKIQIDYLNKLIADSAPAIQRDFMPDTSPLPDKSGETERIQMAHYLHDTLVNDLSFLNFKIEQIQNLIDLKEFSGLQPELNIARIIAKRSYKLVRDMLYRLRESEPADLVFTLKQFVDVVSSRANLEIDFVMEGQPRRLRPDVNRNILYIVREALRNAEKHANANHIDVVMVWDFESLRITISDNGTGFLPDSVQQEKKHFGLNIVRECAEEINANLEINSVLNGGTQLTLTLSL